MAPMAAVPNMADVAVMTSHMATHVTAHMTSHVASAEAMSLGSSRDCRGAKHRRQRHDGAFHFRHRISFLEWMAAPGARRHSAPPLTFIGVQRTPVRGLPCI